MKWVSNLSLQSNWPNVPYIYIVSRNLLLDHYKINHMYDGIHKSITAVSQYEVVEPDNRRHT